MIGNKWRLGMLELVFVVCSIVEGQSCKQLPPIPLEPNTHVVACALASQIEGVKWIEAHPNYYIQRATCKPIGNLARA
jgi:hypothetical protein